MLHSADGDSELYLDDSLRPILVTCWVGSPTAALAERYHEWLDRHIARAKREGSKLFLVSDGTAAGRPSATVRRVLADHMPYDRVVLKHLAVVDNPVVRGAITAIGWLIGDDFDVETRQTLSSALSEVAGLAASLGIAVAPAEVLQRYTTRSARSAS